MDAMKWIAWIALVTACQRGDDGRRNGAGARAPQGSDSVIVQLPRAPVTAEYKQDIANLCDVLHLSGADQLPPGDRSPSIAMWLGPNIKTDAGHKFLVAIQPLSGEPKATALELEARRVGLDGCALAAEWR
jgi:hypothetical protein